MVAFSRSIQKRERIMSRAGVLVYADLSPGASQKSLQEVHTCFTKATTRPSLTSSLQKRPRKYGFMANVMSGAMKACRLARTDLICSTTDVCMLANNSASLALLSCLPTRRGAARFCLMSVRQSGKDRKQGEITYFEKGY